MKKVILFGLILSFLVACNSTTKSDKNEAGAPLQDTIAQSDTHNARTSLDYYGVYEGVTPCADCEGIKVTVTLNKDETYLLKDVYLKNGKEVNPSEHKGKFTWNDAGSVITLEGAKDIPSHFFVAEGKLVIVDKDGKDINPDMKDSYTLKQTEAF